MYAFVKNAIRPRPGRHNFSRWQVQQRIIKQQDTGHCNTARLPK